MPSIAKAFLRYFKFNIVEDPKGLTQVIEHVHSINAKLEHANDRDSVIGVVIPLCTEIERVLHGLITFYGNIFYGKDYWNQFSSWSKNFIRDKMTLGMKCNLLRKMENEIVKDNILKTKLIDLFGGREFLIGLNAIDSLSKILPERNDFSHFKDEIDRLGFRECKVRLKKMSTEILVFLCHLESCGIFPGIINVIECVQDRFGRKYINCKDDRGRIEKVFTDYAIDPAKHYFL